MSRIIKLPPPSLQISFAHDLNRFRAKYLLNALLETVKSLKISIIDKQLARYVSNKDMAHMAQYGLRGEMLFPVPVILEQNPFLLGYYRLLMGYSQKEFYGNNKGFGIGPFKCMEERGEISRAVAADVPKLCQAFCEVASSLLRGIENLKPNKELLDDLTLLTVGPQFRGGANNKRGVNGIIQVFEAIQAIVKHSVAVIDEKTIIIKNATGRNVFVEFAPDPDIVIREEMSPNRFRNIVAIEIKSGQDVSNIHNRIGEAEKSHQKARQQSFTECWTIVNVNRLDLNKARAESPSTDRFYSLKTLLSKKGEEYDDFRDRIISLTSIIRPG